MPTLEQLDELSEQVRQKADYDKVPSNKEMVVNET